MVPTPSLVLAMAMVVARASVTQLQWWLQTTRAMCVPMERPPTLTSQRARTARHGLQDLVACALHVEPDQSRNHQRSLPLALHVVQTRL
eukprot:COSAG06_NODE_44474_length_363_cov_0.776515_1_plen_88_part_01